MQAAKAQQQNTEQTNRATYPHNIQPNQAYQTSSRIPEADPYSDRAPNSSRPFSKQAQEQSGCLIFDHNLIQEGD
jgi:hypothetical protein